MSWKVEQSILHQKRKNKIKFTGIHPNRINLVATDSTLKYNEKSAES